MSEKYPAEKYQGPLTPKEKKIVESFEEARPGLGKRAESNVRSLNTGWREIIADMSEEEIKAEAQYRGRHG